MKVLFFWIVFLAIIVLAVYVPVVRWVIGVALLLIIAFMALFLYILKKSDDENSMIKKFGKDYKTAIENGQLSILTKYPCKPNQFFTSKSEIESITNFRLPNFTVKECKETLKDMSGDFSGEAIIEFEKNIDDNIIFIIEDEMRQSQSKWKKRDDNHYLCDLLVPNMSTQPVEDEYWQLIIQKGSSLGEIKYGKV